MAAAQPLPRTSLLMVDPRKPPVDSAAEGLVCCVESCKLARRALCGIDLDISAPVSGAHYGRSDKPVKNCS